MVKGKV